MSKKAGNYLTRREQQIMEVIYRQEQTDVAEVMAGLPDPLSNSSVRTHLRILEGKGHLTHTEENGRFLYRPTKARPAAARLALVRLLQTFFDDSAEAVVATLLSVKAGDLAPEELDRLKAMIDAHRPGDQPGNPDPDA